MRANRENTHKKIIINNIFNKTGLPSNYIAKIVDDIISIVKRNLVVNETVKIKNFGIFSLKKKNKRFGRNPKNKIVHEISERKVVTFKVSNDFKKKLNDNIAK